MAVSLLFRSRVGMVRISSRNRGRRALALSLNFHSDHLIYAGNPSGIPQLFGMSIGDMDINPFGTREKQYKLPYASFRHREKVTSSSMHEPATNRILELRVVQRSGGLHHQHLQKNNHTLPRKTLIMNRHFSSEASRRVSLEYGCPSGISCLE